MLDTYVSDERGIDPGTRVIRGDGVPILVGGVTSPNLETGKAGPQGEGAQATESTGP